MRAELSRGCAGEIAGLENRQTWGTRENSSELGFAGGFGRAGFGQGEIEGHHGSDGGGNSVDEMRLEARLVEGVDGIGDEHGVSAERSDLGGLAGFGEKEGEDDGALN